MRAVALHYVILDLKFLRVNLFLWGNEPLHGFVSRQSRVINPLAALLNSQLVCLPPVGILKTCYVSFAMFVSVVGVARL